MASQVVVSGKVVGDKYRSYLHDEANSTQWRHGGPPIYDDVNKLFEEGRIKVQNHTYIHTYERCMYVCMYFLCFIYLFFLVSFSRFWLLKNNRYILREWPKGSLEETVQNAVKSWEMELSHKTRLQDFKTINPEKFKLFVNGREGLSAEETLSLGSYNALLKNSLPEELKYYKADEETFESSHEVFRSAFPRGFAWEVIKVYSGPPEIAFKFRHWGFFEGPFKGHAPTGKMVEFYGLGTLKVDDSLKVEEVEIYYDPAELMGDLLSGTHTDNAAISKACPFSK